MTGDLGTNPIQQANYETLDTVPEEDKQWMYTDF